MAQNFRDAGDNRSGTFGAIVRKDQFPAANLFLHVEIRELEKALAKTLGEVEKRGYRLKNIELILTDDAEQGALNEKFLGLRGPTNILSFPDPSEESGTLFLSMPTFERESFFYGQDPASYLARLLAHGIAHLCGLEHGEAMDELCEELIKVWEAGEGGAR